MEELSQSQKAIKLNPQAPHLDNHIIVLELAGFEERFDKMDNYLREQRQEEGALIDGLTKQINYLQDKVKELEGKYPSAKVIEPQASITPVESPVSTEPQA